MHASDAGQLRLAPTHVCEKQTNAISNLFKPELVWPTDVSQHHYLSTVKHDKTQVTSIASWDLYKAAWLAKPRGKLYCSEFALLWIRTFFYRNHSFYQEKSILRYWILFILKSLTLIAWLRKSVQFLTLQRSFLKLRDSCDLIFQEKQKILYLLYRKSNLFNIAEISFMIFHRYGRTKKWS